MVAVPFEELKRPAREGRQCRLENGEGLAQPDQSPAVGQRPWRAKLYDITVLAIVGAQI